jgi:hypothetical protein
MAEKRSRHGLMALKVRVKVRGLAAIDMRTSAAQALIAWRNELLRDLGGEESISAQRMALVELSVRTRLFLDHLDSYLLSQSSLINKRRKGIVPVLRERQQLADGLARLLGQLGLNRVPKPIPSLREFIEAHDAGKAEDEAQEKTPA